MTIDAAALCLKSGNAVVLRGSSTRRALERGARELAASAAPRARASPTTRSSQLAGGGREELVELATQTRYVDLIIPRGGEGLKAALHRARDGAGDLRRLGQLPRLRRRRAPTSTTRSRSSLNAKVQRPGRLQRRRDAARAPRRRRGVPARARSRRSRRPASSCAATSARARSRARPPVAPATDGGLGHRVPRADARGRRRRHRSTTRSSTSPRTAPATARRS